MTKGRCVARSTTIRTRRTTSADRNSRNGRMQSSGIRFCRQDNLASQTFQNIDRTNLLDRIAKKVWALTDQGRHEIRQTPRVAALQNINGQPSRCAIRGLDLSVEVMLFLSKRLEGGGSLLTGTGIPHEHAASPRIMGPKKHQ